MLNTIARLLPGFALIIAGCSGSPTEARKDPTGSYTLVTINGKALPGLVSQTNDRTIELLSSSINLTADHRFSFSGRTRTTAATGVLEMSQAGFGTWARRGLVLDITPDDLGIFPPSAVQWDGGGTLTLTDPTGSVPVTMVFKQ